MSINDDGGPAFPNNPEMVIGGPGWQRTIPGTQGGMSLRDYFAAQALAGVMTGAEGLGGTPAEDRASMFATVAGLLYEVADAMLKERQK